MEDCQSLDAPWGVTARLNVLIAFFFRFQYLGDVNLCPFAKFGQICPRRISRFLHPFCTEVARLRTWHCRIQPAENVLERGVFLV
jgi:hypothetical protein